MKIKFGVVIVAVYSRSRKERGLKLTIEEAKKAFLEGSDCLLTHYDGHDINTYCSIRDFAQGSMVRVCEGAEHTVFVLSSSQMKAHLDTLPILSVEDGNDADDVVDFMTGLPVELD